MNGKYSVASVDKQDVPFNDDYASKGAEYFDVWSPEIATTYGENYWTSMGTHPLPDHIIKRFAGKVIAITGYEQDQVLVDPVGKPGVHPDHDVSVPINWAYNHHYMAWMVGSHSSMVEVAAEPGDTSAHGAPTKWVAEDLPSAATRAVPDAPTSLLFSEGNGGESRKSFHGYPKKFAQLLESPTAWHLTPMQIDTRRRDCGVTRDDVHKCVEFEPWLEPKQARYGRKVDQANYSGILECPCNERYGGDPIFYPDAQTKRLFRRYGTLPGGQCHASQAIANATTCWLAALDSGVARPRLRNVSLDDPSHPPGCTLVAASDGYTVAATFNKHAASKAACPAGGVRRGVATSQVNVTLNLTLDATPAGGLATLTISGPSDAWFGVGLGATAMADSPYTIVCNASGAFEQQIGTCGSEAEHCIGEKLDKQSLTTVSNSAVDGVRTLVLTRPFRGASRQHFSFDLAKNSRLEFITAVGYDQKFAYHRAHHTAALSMLAPAGEATCLCDEGEHAALCHHGGGACHEFTKGCYRPWDGKASSWGGDLLSQDNPTCNSKQYSGGLTCCGHRRVMLDVDQDPGPDLLRYHMKFRFWFQEYTPGTPTPGEYVHRPGSLPRGFDARAPLNTSLADALKTCTATKGCTGVTFEGPAPPPAAATDPTKRRTYFKNGTTIANGDPHWQSYVVQRPDQSHHHLPRFYYQTEANAGEYDVPPAFRRHGDPPIPGYPDLPVSTGPGKDLHLTPGTTCTGGCPHADDCACEHSITFHWVMSNARMLYAGGHCHAPSCIDIELYRNDTGTPELLCRQASKYGQGDVRRDRFDEKGYVVLPPCLWGEASEGLMPPSWLPANTPMYSIKRNRNTWAGHFGEMASWQMRGVHFPAAAPAPESAAAFGVPPPLVEASIEARIA